MKMKNLYLGMGAFFITAFLYVVTGPYIAIRGIKSGLDNNNDTFTSKYIDMVELHKNIKSQLSEQFTLSSLNGRQIHGDAAKLINSLSSDISEIFAQAIVSKPGLLQVFSGKNVLDNPAQKIGAPDMNTGFQKITFLKDGVYHFDSWNHFGVSYKGEGNLPYRLILSRQFMEWKVTNIELPSLANAIPR